MGTALLDIYMQYKHITEHFTSYSDVMAKRERIVICAFAMFSSRPCFVCINMNAPI